MPICDLCEKEKEEVFEPTVKIVYAKGKELDKVKFCKECMEFINFEDED